MERGFFFPNNIYQYFNACLCQSKNDAVGALLMVVIECHGGEVQFSFGVVVDGSPRVPLRCGQPSMECHLEWYFFLKSLCHWSGSYD